MYRNHIHDITSPQKNHKMSTIHENWAPPPLNFQWDHNMFKSDINSFKILTGMQDTAGHENL